VRPWRRRVVGLVGFITECMIQGRCNSEGSPCVHQP
jgi:hypothetical protein